MPEPKIAQKKPYMVDLKAGEKKSWCACGHSSMQPFCDGSHNKEAKEFSPKSFTAEKDGTVALCGCKHTKNPPFCDGSHNKL